MRNTILNVLVAPLFLTLSVNLFGLEGSSIVAGDRVQVTAPNYSSSKIIGTVVSFDVDTLMLNRGG